MINTEFKSIRELIKAFPDEQTCIDHLERLRWNGNVVSPFDADSKVYKCAGNKYKCKSTGKYFNVRTATLFDNSKVELQTWFLAIYIITSHKKGISSLQLSRDLNVTQKTAWFLLHRIRNCFGLADNEGTDKKLGGGGQLVEVDETYVGGKVKNFNQSKRKRVEQGAIDINDNKSCVMGYLERGGKLRMEIVKRNNILNATIANLEQDTVLMTDTSGAYYFASKYFAAHEKVDHAKKEFVREKMFHTNTIEGVFSLFDRGYIGIYHYMSQKHLQKYCDEFSFRYNTRKAQTKDRFNLLLQYSAKRLTYQNLIQK